LERYPSLKNEVGFLADFSAQNRNADLAGRIIFNEKNEEVFNFGKYKGQKVSDVLKEDIGYYGWIMNGDFSLYTKKVLTEIRLREFNK
jgi:DNA polymerase-3 subunit epsilon